MQPGHILVAVLSVVTFALLVWIEMRSRRNIAAEEQKNAAAARLPDVPPAPAKARTPR